MSALVRIAAALLLVAAPASATPLVAIDVDLEAAGIQSTREVELDQTFEVGVAILDVEAADPLIGFEFELLFEESILAGLDVSSGGFLPPPSFVLDEQIGSGFVDFSETTFAATGASGSGLLARIQLDAIDLGASGLDLDPLILSGLFGEPIAFELQRAEIHVAATAIPEPGAALMFGLGFLLVGTHLSRRARPIGNSRTARPHWDRARTAPACRSGSGSSKRGGSPAS